MGSHQDPWRRAHRHDCAIRRRSPTRHRAERGERQRRPRRLRRHAEFERPTRQTRARSSSAQQRACARCDPTVARPRGHVAAVRALAPGDALRANPGARPRSALQRCPAHRIERQRAGGQRRIGSASDARREARQRSRRSQRRRPSARPLAARRAQDPARRARGDRDPATRDRTRHATRARRHAHRVRSLDAIKCGPRHEFHRDRPSGARRARTADAARRQPAPAGR